MNLLSILLLVLWSAFNSSDAWYRNYRTTEPRPPHTTAQPQLTGSSSEPRWYNTPYYWTTSKPPLITTQHPWTVTSEAWRIRGYPSTPGASSKPCGYWYNKPCYWATTQPSETSTTQQRQTQTPYRRRLYYQTPSKPADAPEPNIAVYGQMQDREHVIVMCSFGRRFTKSSFQLSVEGEHNYTLKDPLCYSNEKCVFDVKVSPPVSFTCVHEINSAVNRRSETYTYSPSDFPAVLNQREEGVSSFYIGFFSFIVVGLVIMTAAVIMATFKSNAKGSKTTGAANDYTDV